MNKYKPPTPTHELIKTGRCPNLPPLGTNYMTNEYTLVELPPTVKNNEMLTKEESKPIMLDSGIKDGIMIIS